MRNPTMPRARSQIQDDWQTAAAPGIGSGCLSFYVLPPLAALVIVGLVAILALKSPLTPRALPMSDSNGLFQTTAPPSSKATTSGLSPIFTKEVQHWGTE